MKIFVSYGSIPDQVTALRLQALGAVNGLTIFVPPAYSRQDFPPRQSLQLFPDLETDQKLKEAEVLIGVIGNNGISLPCRQELDVGKQLGKTMIIMAYPDVAATLQHFFPSNVIVIDPTNPIAAETAIVQYLKGMGVNAQQDTAKAVIALGILALGLVLLAGITTRDA